MLDRRDGIVETSRATPVVRRALVNAIGEGNIGPLWRSEVDGMDVQGDPFLRHEAPNAESDLSQRLIAVQHRLTDAIDQAPPGAIRVISACAGQGHDVIGVLRSHPRKSEVHTLLVESDDDNVRVARARIAAAGIPGVDVRQADAGNTGTYRDAIPADVLMFCGIFGNVSDEDVRRTVNNASRLCTPQATVLWTRHRRDPDRTDQIRSWFAEAGYEELAFDSPGPDRFALGTLRLAAPPLAYRSDLRLFTFRT